MFQDEARYKIDHFINTNDMGLPEHNVAKTYVDQRSKIVQQIMTMGKKFKQRVKTLHIAIELCDRFFLDKRAQGMPQVQGMTARKVNIVVTTCFLIASKYDEIDDQLVFINDTQKYYQRSGNPSVPTWTDIVETERMLMNFFGWDLGFVLPIHYVEMFLANGVLFESEPINQPKTKETAKKISNKCYEVLDEMIR